MNQDELSVPENSETNGLSDNYERYLNPNDINVPSGYNVEVFYTGLDTPISLVFAEDGSMLIGDAGIISGNGKVIRLSNEGYEVIADGFNPPLTGINYLDGDIYVSHRGKITLVKPDGSKLDLLSGLPSFGDHHNNQVIFGPDGKMYFGQGTATNSGVVGTDNHWVMEHPCVHDYPGADILLNGYNFITENMLSNANEYVSTGAYSSFGTPTIRQNEMVKGNVRASGSILRANLDGSALELVSWGFRNPFRLKFDRYNQLYSTNHGSDVRGSRPIANSPDEFHLVNPGCWYGWPDFTGGKPVTSPEFKPESGTQPQFLLTSHPPVVRPFALFEPHSAIMGFDFNYNREFGPLGDAYIAEFGSEAPETTGGVPLPGVGHRISKIDMLNGSVTTFAINRSGLAASESGEGGLERPIDVVFGADGAMYVLDFGVNMEEDHHGYHPRSGVIWRITKN